MGLKILVFVFLLFGAVILTADANKKKKHGGGKVGKAKPTDTTNSEAGDTHDLLLCRAPMADEGAFVTTVLRLLNEARSRNCPMGPRLEPDAFEMQDVQVLAFRDPQEDLHAELTDRAVCLYKLALVSVSTGEGLDVEFRSVDFKPRLTETGERMACALMSGAGNEAKSNSHDVASIVAYEAVRLINLKREEPEYNCVAEPNHRFGKVLLDKVFGVTSQVVGGAVIQKVRFLVSLDSEQYRSEHVEHEMSVELLEEAYGGQTFYSLWSTRPCNLCSLDMDEGCESRRKTIHRSAFGTGSFLNNNRALFHGKSYDSMSRHLLGRKTDRRLESREFNVGVDEVVEHHKLSESDVNQLPKNFFWYSEHPECRQDVKSQDTCGSCWAMSASTVLETRMCYRSGGLLNKRLSPQHQVACNHGNSGCEGGVPTDSWEFLATTGTVEEECLGYLAQDNIGYDSDPCELVAMCPHYHAKDTVDSKVASKGPVVQISNDEKASMLELVHGGPLEVSMQVWKDFMTYQGGVYRKAPDQIDGFFDEESSVWVEGDSLGGHSVVLVGWGERWEDQCEQLAQEIVDADRWERGKIWWQFLDLEDYFDDHCQIEFAPHCVNIDRDSEDWDIYCNPAYCQVLDRSDPHQAAIYNKRCTLEFGSKGISDLVRLEKYWILQNSWGPDFGENGFFRVPRGENIVDIDTAHTFGEPDVDLIDFTIVEGSVVPPEGTITVQWYNPFDHSDGDWIGLFPTGTRARDDGSIEWTSIRSSERQGEVDINMEGIAPGEYMVKYCVEGASNCVKLGHSDGKKLTVSNCPHVGKRVCNDHGVCDEESGTCVCYDYEDSNTVSFNVFASSHSESTSSEYAGPVCQDSRCIKAYGSIHCGTSNFLATPKGNYFDVPFSTRTWGPTSGPEITLILEVTEEDVYTIDTCSHLTHAWVYHKLYLMSECPYDRVGVPLASGVSLEQYCTFSHNAQMIETRLEPGTYWVVIETSCPDDTCEFGVSVSGATGCCPYGAYDDYMSSDLVTDQACSGHGVCRDGVTPVATQWQEWASRMFCTDESCTYYHVIGGTIAKCCVVENEDPDEVQAGLLAEYYHLTVPPNHFVDFDTYLPSLVIIEPSIEKIEAKDWSVCGQFFDNSFGARWKGSVILDQTVEVTIYVLSDDHVRLSLDGEQIIDHPPRQPTEVYESEVTLELEHGEHPILIDMIRQLGTQLVVSYETPTIDKQPIPANSFGAPQTDLPGCVELHESYLDDSVPCECCEESEDSFCWCREQCVWHKRHSIGACTCQPGWVGEGCYWKCPTHHNAICTGHGACHSTYEVRDDGTKFESGVECVCDDGWSGEACSFECPVGYNGETCSGPLRGRCTGAVGTCECLPGYEGLACETSRCPVDEIGNACSNHGECLVSGVCECHAPFEGQTCDESADCIIAEPVLKCNEEHTFVINTAGEADDYFDLGPDAIYEVQVFETGTMQLDVRLTEHWEARLMLFRECPTPEYVESLSRDAVMVCEDSCPQYPHWAKDGVCDEPKRCDSGTDCTDCGPASIGEGDGYVTTASIEGSETLVSIGFFAEDGHIILNQFWDYKTQSWGDFLEAGTYFLLVDGFEREDAGGELHLSFHGGACGCKHEDGVPCGGRGKCINDQCVCFDGYYGDLCENRCPSDNTMVCSGHGECNLGGDKLGESLDIDIGKCLCNAGWTGHACGEPLDCFGGHDLPCSGAGSCVNLKGGLCACHGMAAGRYCETTEPSCLFDSRDVHEMTCNESYELNFKHAPENLVSQGRNLVFFMHIFEQASVVMTTCDTNHESVQSFEWPRVTEDGCTCLESFEYEGIIFNECTDLNHHRDWCYTDPATCHQSWGECSDPHIDERESTVVPDTRMRIFKGCPSAIDGTASSHVVGESTRGCRNSWGGYSEGSTIVSKLAAGTYFIVIEDMSQSELLKNSDFTLRVSGDDCGSLPEGMHVQPVAKTKTFTLDAAGDTTLSNFQPDMNYGSKTDLVVGDGHRTVISFATSEILSRYKIKEATLEVEVQNVEHMSARGEVVHVDSEHHKHHEPVQAVAFPAQTDLVEGGGDNAWRILRKKKKKKGKKKKNADEPIHPPDPTGEGATWHCEVDREISDDVADCLASPSGQVMRWDGGFPVDETNRLYPGCNPLNLAQISHKSTNRCPQNKICWDVTCEAEAGANTWTVRTHHSDSDVRIKLLSRETGASPTLKLKTTPHMDEGPHCQDGKCGTGVCVASLCIPPTCSDGHWNGHEEGVDCGGDCPNPCYYDCSLKHGVNGVISGSSNLESPPGYGLENLVDGMFSTYFINSNYEGLLSQAHGEEVCTDQAGDTQLEFAYNEDIFLTKMTITASPHGNGESDPVYFTLSGWDAETETWIEIYSFRGDYYHMLFSRRGQHVEISIPQKNRKPYQRFNLRITGARWCGAPEIALAEVAFACLPIYDPDLP